MDVSKRSAWTGTYFCCLGDAFAEDFDFEVTEIGVELKGCTVSEELWRILGIRRHKKAYCDRHLAKLGQALFRIPQSFPFSLARGDVENGCDRQARFRCILFVAHPFVKLPRGYPCKSSTSISGAAIRIVHSADYISENLWEQFQVF